MRNLQARVVLIRFARVAGACAGKQGKHFYVSNLNYRKVSNFIVTLAIFLGAYVDVKICAYAPE